MTLHRNRAITIFVAVTFSKRIDMSPYFGSNPIRELRELANISQEMLALQSGLTDDYLDRLEAGVERRWTVRLRPLAAALDVPVEGLVAA
jgi:hypothetical protein